MIQRLAQGAFWTTALLAAYVALHVVAGLGAMLIESLLP